MSEPAEPRPAPSGPLRHTHTRRDFPQAARLATTPIPPEVAADHETELVYASGQGPASDPGELLTHVLTQLAREASRLGCSAVYNIHHTLAVDAGTIYITALGTGTRPIVDVDAPPQRL